MHAFVSKPPATLTHFGISTACREPLQMGPPPGPSTNPAIFFAEKQKAADADALSKSVLSVFFKDILINETVYM